MDLIIDHPAGSAPEPFPPPPRDETPSGGATVLGMLDAIGEIYPHRVVLDDGRRRLSPFLLGLMVRRLARAILDLAPAGPVAVGLREGGMGIVATLAALAAGRDCVIVDPGRLPEAAQGCACLVRVPRDGGAVPPGCVPLDVFLSCGLSYALAGPDLPNAAASSALIRFGDPSGPGLPLTRLVADGSACLAAHPPDAGALWCPDCLGALMGTLLSGRAVRIGTAADG